MTDTTISFDFSKLTPAQCILLAEELWEKARNHAELAPITPAQAEELRARVDAYEAGKLPPSQTWEEVKYWLEQQ
jgi:putative addiction module component (TIGR02574 family)